VWVSSLHDSPFAAPHKFISYRGQTSRARTLASMRAVDRWHVHQVDGGSSRWRDEGVA
jgi:hypothetical protein